MEFKADGKPFCVSTRVFPSHALHWESRRLKHMNCKHCDSENVIEYKQISESGILKYRINCLSCLNSFFLPVRIMPEKLPYYSLEDYKNFKIKLREARKQRRKEKKENIKNEAIKILKEHPEKFNNFIITKNIPIKLRKKLRSKLRKGLKGFYDTWEWKELRFRVFEIYGRKCMSCFTTEAELHVDHIKPISKYPELATDLNNLQVLCKDCNMGKSNKWDYDFRPKEILTKDKPLD